MIRNKFYIGVILSNKKDLIEAEGVVVEILPDSSFKILLDNGINILGHLSGKMRLHKIKILLKDKVKVELSPYDLSKGRIVYRSK